MVASPVLGALAAANRRLIAENPTPIVIQRTETRPTPDGGMRKINFRLASFQGRLIPRKGIQASRQDEAGIFVSSGWLLVAPGIPLLLEGDVAQIGSKDYNIIHVVRRVYAAIPYAQHADVEEVLV
ncbi:MAG: hypothetical protein DDT34_02021 [Firmicutes bacterium]|nr:hypothetical protein [Bacillota bacterium]